MKKGILLLIVFIVLAFPVFSQQAVFQGKLYSNGIPVNGQHNIEFYIGTPLNWSSNPTSINVVNGLYSTVINFPSNLFGDNASSRQMVVILNNSPIDTVELFAPLERDSIAKSYIRDSIKWINIHDKPVVDTSYTNEIQTISINGDTLAISSGNKIILPFSHIKNLTVYEQFKVIDTALHQSISYLGTGFSTCGGATNQSFWQSFKATENGKLRQITMPVASSCNNSVTVYIYAGEGVSSQYLGYKNCAVSNTLGIQTLDLSSGVSSSSKGYITLETGKVYTFQITPPVGCLVLVGCNNNNPYPDGISSINAATDIPFLLWMDRSAPPSFTLNDRGYVGIGIDSPTAQLEVKGRIKDQTGYVAPAGMMAPFGGSNVPEGWLLCDGRAVSRTDYADLFSAIGIAHGAGNGTTTFNLPDTRGMFLRGVDNSPTVGSSGNDPNRNTRSASNSGGNTGVAVGSVQSDDYKSHTHGIYGPFYNISTSGGAGHFSILSTRLYQSDPSGGNETRPKNIYVYYMIKY